MKMVEVPGSEFELPPTWCCWRWASSRRVVGARGFGVEKDARGNARAATTARAATGPASTSLRRRRHAARPVARRVAIREGRQCARAVDEYLMGASTLPR